MWSHRFPRNHYLNKLEDVSTPFNFSDKNCLEKKTNTNKFQQYFLPPFFKKVWPCIKKRTDILFTALYQLNFFFNDFRTLVKNGLGWQIEWQTDSQKDRQREKKTDRQTGRPIARSKMVKKVHICYHVKWAQNTSTKINMLMF